jgi:hypothetical protein
VDWIFCKGQECSGDPSFLKVGFWNFEGRILRSKCLFFSFGSSGFGVKSRECKEPSDESSFVFEGVLF